MSNNSPLLAGSDEPVDDRARPTCAVDDHVLDRHNPTNIAHDLDPFFGDDELRHARSTQDETPCGIDVRPTMDRRGPRMGARGTIGMLPNRGHGLSVARLKRRVKRSVRGPDGFNVISGFSHLRMVLVGATTLPGRVERVSEPPALRLPPIIDELDLRVDELWEMLRGNPLLDRIFYSASTAGDFSAIWHGYNVVRLIAAADGRSRFVRLAAALAFESVLVNQGIKRAFRRDRPDHDSKRPHHLRSPSTSSFPSGHASSAVMAVSLINQRSALPMLTRLVGTVVATSRIHVRIHHASDVVAGAGVGLVLAAAWKRAWPLR